MIWEDNAACIALASNLSQPWIIYKSVFIGLGEQLGKNILESVKTRLNLMTYSTKRLYGPAF
jgi:hypothetical protein